MNPDTNHNPNHNLSTYVAWCNRIKALGAVLLILVMGIFVPVTIALVDSAETLVLSMKREYSGFIEALKVWFDMIKKGEQTL